jgi:hypothetical protein
MYTFLNGIGIITQILNDSGANGFLFINIRFTITLSSFLETEIIPLIAEILFKNFDKKINFHVTHALFLNISIDGRRQLLAPFFIIDINGHDVIIERK